MFFQIAAFEFRYQIRQPVFWVAVVIFGLLSFGLIATDNVSLTGGSNIHENSGFGITVAVIGFSQFFMFVSTALVANVVIRDDETGFGPILRATRVSKFDYLIGRFSGAFAAASLAFLAVPIGILAGTFMPWVDRETLEPNLVQNYVWPLLVMGLPNILLLCAIFFAVATVTRSMMSSYVAVVVFLVANLAAGIATANQPEFREAVALLEPLGGSAVVDATRYWTPAESNTRLPDLGGMILWNRLLMIAVSLAALAGAYFMFRVEARGKKLSRKQRLEKMADVRTAPEAAAAEPMPTGRFDRATAWTQFVYRLKLEIGQIVRSPAFPILLAIGMIFSGLVLWFPGQVFGAENYPTTRIIIRGIQGGFAFIFLIVAVYYAGELVWRERDKRFNEIVDASGLPDWAFVAPKTIALALVLITVVLTSVLAGIIVQLAKGWYAVDIGRYLLWYVLPMSVDMLLLAALAVFVQAIVPHKFIGWGVMVVYIISNIVLGNLGLESELYRYSQSGPEPLTDMNGQGDFWKGAWWLRLYWSAFALILLVAAYGLWRRGTEVRFMPRLRLLPSKLRGPAGVVAGVALAVFVATGAWAYTNMYVWNEYRTNLSSERWLADYEKTFLQFESVPQPVVTDVTLNVELHPHQPLLRARGTYVLENRTGRPVDQLHVRFDRDARVVRVAVPGATLQREWPEFNYRILRLARPMAPGERIALAFDTALEQRGFRHRDNLTSVVDNGTFVNNGAFSPRIGMDRSGILSDPARRRRYDLPEVRMAQLGDRASMNRNYIGADWVNSDITISTVADQTPIAPGYVVSDVTANGRRTARFRSEAPVLNFFSVQSARYAVRRQNWRGVDLAVYYHPEHPWNVDRMLAASRVGLDYFQANFSPYQFRQFRILEFPGYASFAQAYANTIPYSEDIGFTLDVRDPDTVDGVTYVTAHELGHQWWAHQIVGADQQGQTVLSETLAQYSALMVMERLYGPDKIRRFLKRELDRYLQARGSGGVDEQPLIRVENQQYIHYNKGALIMYLLRDQMGEAAVNRALRTLLQRHAFGGAPYPTSVDLVRALRAEASPEQQTLITDLFERITLYDVRVRDSEVRERPDGRFDVRMTVEAQKFYADGQGNETRASMYETFDVGVFADRPGVGAFDRQDVILLERRPIRSGVQTFTFTVNRRPRFVGVDPYNKWLDRNSEDNVAAAG